MKLVLYALKGCPYTHSMVKLIKKFNPIIKTLSPLTFTITTDKNTSTEIEFIITPQDKDRANNLKDSHGILIQSYPTIVKLHKNKYHIFEGKRTKRAFQEFLHQSNMS